MPPRMSIASLINLPHLLDALIICDAFLDTPVKAKKPFNMGVNIEHEEIGTRSFLDGRHVRKRFGDEVKLIPGDGVLQKTYTPIGFFFSAQWCENSRKFVPYLKDFYNKMKEKGQGFDVIYISSDNSVDEMEEFMLEFHDECLALYGLYYDEEDEESQLCWALRERYQIKRIPQLYVEFGMHPVHAPQYELLDYGVYPGLNPFGISDIIEFGEEAWDMWMAYIANALDWRKFTEDEDNRVKKSVELGEEYKLNKYILRTDYSEIYRHPLWQPTESPLSIFSGLKLVRNSEATFVEENAQDALGDVDIIGLFFSCMESENCHTATVALKESYGKWKSDGESFEVVFMSKDNSSEEMETYMKAMHGDWLAVAFDEDWEKRLGENFIIPSMPSLLIVNKTGEIVSRKGETDVKWKKEEAMESWKQGQPAVTHDDEIEAHVRWMQKNLENDPEEISDENVGKDTVETQK